MSDRTSIEWTDASWNPIRAKNRATGRVGWHCEHKSEGCRHCYAEAFNRRLGTKLDYKPGHLVTRGPQPRGLVELFLEEKMLLLPLKWRKPRKIFVCSMTDLFADFVPDEWIDRMFAIMALCPQHVFQVLTKRPERMREYLCRAGTDRPTAGHKLNRCGIVWETAFSIVSETPGKFSAALDAQGVTMAAMPWPLRNVWLGVSVEEQAVADERIPPLLATPAAVRWLSCEPLLGPVNLTMVAPYGDGGYTHALRDAGHRIDWVVAGGESGSSARPMHPDWARSLRDQCAAAGVPFLFKQWGTWAPGEIAGGFLDPERPAKGLRFFDGQWDECWSEPDGHCDDEPDVYRLDKSKAGRMLHGVEHDGFPA